MESLQAAGVGFCEGSAIHVGQNNQLVIFAQIVELFHRVRESGSMGD